MGKSLVYPKEAKNTIHRSSDRAKYELQTIHEIIMAAHVVNVSFASLHADDPFPHTVPMIGAMGSYAHPSANLSEPLDCYLHGYVSSGIMKVARSHPEKGVPMTIAATKVDGIVLSLTPNTHSYNYRSAVLFGYGTLVDDIEEKTWAMKLVTNSVLTGRWDESRVPPDAGEMASTNILRVRVVNGSGKVRDGGPNDDKKDTENASITERVWTGVIPMHEVIGEPVAGGASKVKGVPEHIRNFIEDTNEENDEYAKNASKIVSPQKRAAEAKD